MHMRTDGDAELDALFSVLNNREALLCSSFKNRKLPASFFTPPTPKHANMGHRGRQASSIHEYTQPEPLHCRSISSPSQAIDNYWNQQTSSKFYPGSVSSIDLYIYIQLIITFIYPFISVNLHIHSYQSSFTSIHISKSSHTFISVNLHIHSYSQNSF